MFDEDGSISSAPGAPGAIGASLSASVRVDGDVFGLTEPELLHAATQKSAARKSALLRRMLAGVWLTFYGALFPEAH